MIHLELVLIKELIERFGPNIRKLSCILVTIKFTKNVDSNPCRSMY